MAGKRVLKACLLLCLLGSSLLACDISVNQNGTPVAIQSTSATTPNQIPPLNTWIPAAAGIDLRYEHWKSPGNNEDTVVIARFDLHRVHLSVGYQPSNPLQLSEWMKQSGALAVINGGFFDDHNKPAGLLASNGNIVGTSYSGFGGMLSVDTAGQVSLRSLHDQPYNPDTDQLRQATQSSPMLMVGGKRTQFSANAASQRRSVAALDKEGRLLLIVSPESAFSLDELADLLASSDLSIQTALNLDGGASTGLYVNAGSQKVTVDAFTALPIVIIIK